MPCSTESLIRRIFKQKNHGSQPQLHIVDNFSETSIPGACLERPNKATFINGYKFCYFSEDYIKFNLRFLGDW